MHTPSAIAARPLPKRTRSTAGLEEIDAWLTQITSSTTSTTSSTTPTSASTTHAASGFHEPVSAFVALGAGSRKRHHSLPAASIAGSLQSLAFKDKSTGSMTVRRPELALFASDSPRHHHHQQPPPRPFSNQYSPSLHHDDLETASYAFLPSASHHEHHLEVPTPTSNHHSLSHQSHALPPPLQLPEMSPREDYLVRAFVSDAMKLEGSGYEGDEHVTHSHNQNQNAFALPCSSSSASRTPLEIPTMSSIHVGRRDASTTPISSTTPRGSQQQHHKWSREEDEKLRDAVSRFGGKSWKLIAEMLGNARTDVQCLHRWNKVLKPGLVKGPWTPEEDRVLLGLIARYGVGQIRWCDVALHLPGRIGKQCRERWCNHLDSSIRKGQWTPQEDDTVFRLQQTIGNKWSEIAKHLPGRTENAVKNRFNSAARRKWLMGQANASGCDSGGITPLVTTATAGKAPRGPPAPRGGRLPRTSARGGGASISASGLLSTGLLAGPPRPPPPPPAAAASQSTAFLRGVAFGAMPTTSFVAASNSPYPVLGDSDGELPAPPHHPLFHMPPHHETESSATTTSTASDLAGPAFSFHRGNAFPHPSHPHSPPVFRPQFVSPSATVSSPSLASLTALLAEPMRHQNRQHEKHKGGYEPHDDLLAIDDHTVGSTGDDPNDDIDDDNQVAHSPSVRRASLSSVTHDKRRLSVDSSSVGGCTKHDTEDDDADAGSLRAIDLPDSETEGRQLNEEEDVETHGGGNSPVDMDDQNMSTFLDSVALELDDML